MRPRLACSKVKVGGITHVSDHMCVHWLRGCMQQLRHLCKVRGEGAQVEIGKCITCSVSCSSEEIVTGPSIHSTVPGNLHCKLAQAQALCLLANA
jgi:hypothetical protein